MKKNIKVSFMASVFAVALIGLFTSCEQPTNDALKLQKPTKGIYEFREISKTIELKEYHKKPNDQAEWIKPVNSDDLKLLAREFTKLTYKASLMAISGGNFKNYELVEVTRKATGNVDKSAGFAKDVICNKDKLNNIKIIQNSISGDFTRIDYTIEDNAFPFDNVATAFYYSFKVFDKSKKEYHTFNTKPIATKDATRWKFDNFEIGNATFNETTYSFNIKGDIISMDRDYIFSQISPLINYKVKFDNNELREDSLNLPSDPNEELTVDKPLHKEHTVKINYSKPCEKVELSIYHANKLLATKSFTKDEIKIVIN